MFKENLLDKAFLRGRHLKPILLWGAVSMAIIAQSNFRGQDRGTEYPLSVIVGTMATVALTTIVLSYYTKHPKLVQAGLLGVVAVYATRTAFIWINSPFDQAGWFGLGAILLAAGAYFLEVGDDKLGVPGGRV